MADRLERVSTARPSDNVTNICLIPIHDGSVEFGAEMLDETGEEQ